MTDTVNVIETNVQPDDASVVQNPPQSPVIKLQLTLEEINVILGGLGEIPAKTSIGVIEKVRMQTISQLQQIQQAQMTQVQPVQ